MSTTRSVGGTQQDGERQEEPEGPRVAPGKVSMVQRLAAGPGRLGAIPTSSDGPPPTSSPPPGDDPFAVHLLGGAVQMRAGGDVADADQVHEAAEHGTRGPGGPLPHLDTIQASFGRHDVSQVRAHTDGAAAEGARAMGAVAFAAGDQVAFGETPSLHTAAHEAAHVIQQRAGVHLSRGVGSAGDAYEQHADQVADLVVRGESSEALLGRAVGGGGGSAAVQRYEAGEHAKMGDTHDDIKKAYAPIEYVVVKGDTPDSIAAKFKMTVAELEKANPGKIREVKPKKGAKPGTKPTKEVKEGEHLSIPQKLNAMQQEAAKHPTIKVKVNGVELDYSTLVAMGGDLFGSVEELAKAPPAQLKEIAALVEEEKKTGKAVDTVRWQKATKGRFLELAAQNQSHFAPSNKDLVAVAGKSTGDHKSSWESHHRRALDAAAAGEKDKALLINGFGDHFLTDAFSAGHLFNKSDVMEKFNNQLPLTGTGKKREFTKASKVFFDTIAKLAFVGDVAAEFSKYETAEAYTLGWHPNINSASRFSTLLQGIHQQKPELLESAVAKGVHDKLNTHTGGIPVDNRKGDKWKLSGDNTLNAKTLEISRHAVAQSQQNVLGAFGVKSKLPYADLFKKVWDYTPQPTAEGRKIVVGEVNSGTDVKNSALHNTIVNLIKDNYKTIIAELVKLNKLRKA